MDQVGTAAAQADQVRPSVEARSAKLLKANGYRLRANAKVIEGHQHPDRDAQFEYVNATAAAFLAAGDPVVSVDAKKREQVGEFKTGGREWAQVGAPSEANAHDFPSDAVGVALPYGVCDMATNTGWANVGTDHDTAVFAAESVRRWWRHVGADRYPHATRMSIAATTTRTGLTVKAVLDDNTYPTGLRITDTQMRQLLDRHSKRHEFHGDWNYDVHPTADDDDEALAMPIVPTRPTKRK